MEHSTSIPSRKTCEILKDAAKGKAQGKAEGKTQTLILQGSNLLTSYLMKKYRKKQKHKNQNKSFGNLGKVRQLVRKNFCKESLLSCAVARKLNKKGQITDGKQRIQHPGDCNGDFVQ